VDDGISPYFFIYLTHRVYQMFRWVLGLFSDDSLKQACNKRDITRLKDPIQELREIDDEKGRIYVWEVDSEKKRETWLKALDKAGVSSFESVHIVITDTDELFELSRTELEPYIGAE